MQITFRDRFAPNPVHAHGHRGPWRLDRSTRSIRSGRPPAAAPTPDRVRPAAERRLGSVGPADRRAARLEWIAWLVLGAASWAALAIVLGTV